MWLPTTRSNGGGIITSTRKDSKAGMRKGRGPPPPSPSQATGRKGHGIKRRRAEKPQNDNSYGTLPEQDGVHATTDTLHSTSDAAWNPGNTRICVKNVPKHVTESRLKEFFGQHGQVTDVRIVKTKQGQSRKLAFIGFKTPQEAQMAVSYFHNTYLDTSKLAVEEAKPKGDASLPRPWSQHSEGSSRFEKKRKQSEGGDGHGDGMINDGVSNVKSKQPSEGDQNEGEEGKKSKKRKVGKEEFIAAMMPRSQAKSWANDEALLEQPMAMHIEDGDDDEEEDDDRGEDDGMNVVTEGQNKRSSNGEDASNCEENEEDKHEESVNDLDYLKSKVNKKLDEQAVDQHSSSGDEGDHDGEKDNYDDEDDDEDGEEEEEDEEGDNDNDSVSLQSSGAVEIHRRPGKEEQGRASDAGQDEEEGEEKEEETARLFLRNLPFSATEDDIRDACSQFGEVVDVHLPLDETKRAKGFGFVQFLMPEDAQKVSLAMGLLGMRACRDGSNVMHVWNIAGSTGIGWSGFPRTAASCDQIEAGAPGPTRRNGSQQS